MYNLMKRICNKWDSGDASRIKYIVWHYTAGTNPNAGAAKNNVDYYATSNVSASAHYYVDMGETVWQSVEDKNSAWSVGGSYTPVHPYARNYNTLNIELCSGKYSRGAMQASDKDWYIPAKTIETALELTRDKMKQYGIPASNVIRHWDVCHKECPAPLLDGYNPLPEQGGWTWSKIKAALSGAAPAVKEEPVKTYKNRLNWLVGSTLPLDNGIGKKAVAAITLYQGLYGLKKTGKLDAATKASIDQEYGKMVYYKGQSKPEIKALKAKLAKLGYDVDTATGKYGSKMAKAIAKYMRDYKVPGYPTGLIVNKACKASIEYEAGKKK